MGETAGGEAPGPSAHSPRVLTSPSLRVSVSESDPITRPSGPGPTRVRTVSLAYVYKDPPAQGRPLSAELVQHTQFGGTQFNVGWEAKTKTWRKVGAQAAGGRRTMRRPLASVGARGADGSHGADPTTAFPPRGAGGSDGLGERLEHGGPQCLPLPQPVRPLALGVGSSDTPLPAGPQAPRPGAPSSPRTSSMHDGIWP